jgi:hypothetical protein
MTALVQLLAGFAVGYLYASLLESFFHETVNDAPRSRRLLDWGAASIITDRPELGATLAESEARAHMMAKSGG